MLGFVPHHQPTDRALFTDYSNTFTVSRYELCFAAKTNGIARGPNTTPMTPQNTGSAPLLFATKWQITPLTITILMANAMYICLLPQFICITIITRVYAELVKITSVGWGEERTPTVLALQPIVCWGSFLTPTYVW